MEYYIAVKKNKVITFAHTQMDMESTMLTEIIIGRGNDIKLSCLLVGSLKNRW